MKFNGKRRLLKLIRELIIQKDGQNLSGAQQQLRTADY